jgi:hypothetical protein
VLKKSGSPKPSLSSETDIDQKHIMERVERNAPSRSETMICIMSGEEGPPGNNDESTMTSVRRLSSFC